MLLSSTETGALGSSQPEGHSPIRICQVDYHSNALAALLSVLYPGTQPLAGDKTDKQLKMRLRIVEHIMFLPISL
jgi:hypothetical protein